VFIVQLIRLRVEVMYTTTLIVRSILSLGLLWLAVSTGNPFFAVASRRRPVRRRAHGRELPA
jgi:hypothetical protein